MEDRQAILANIRVNQPALQELPSIPDFTSGQIDLQAKFTSLLDLVSVKWIVLDKNGDLQKVVEDQYPDAKTICSSLEDISCQIRLEPGMPPHQLQDVDLTILKGEFGVAENGAIWVSEADLGVRISAFITQHLVLVLSKDSLVENMHQAYDRMDLTKTGYGVFIAGPSKTADIEQVLVIGAHGPRSLMVVLV